MTALQPPTEADADAGADAALLAAEASFAAFRAAPAETRAQLLEEIAARILALGDDLLTTADAETGLGLVRLTGERARTVNQLKAFASVVREGSWVEARIDTRDAGRTPPKPDLRRMLLPLGPVVVFAASNFPLAFSVAGGDTASALAAGCPVVLRAHPAHPRTSALVATAVAAAVQHLALPAGVFTLVAGDGYAIGLSLVRQRLTRAVAFTGSLRGGRALLDAAAARPEPIPVFAEMGSTNPVFVLPGALAERAVALGEALADSATQGVGQFCTKPGVIFVVADATSASFAAFSDALAARIGLKAPARMLYPDIARRFREGVASLEGVPGVERLAAAPAPSSDEAASGQPIALQVSLEDFLHTPALREEVFGPCTLIIRARSTEELTRAADALEGQLTASLHASAEELGSARPLVAALERKVGRLLFGGVPTGVEVSPAMNHGGPYPASTDARTTSVGSAAIQRFARPLCYQDADASMLPPELTDHNSRGIFRLLNGRTTQDDVAP